MELDTVVLAGEKEGARLIHGANKALLPLRGKPIISYVIEALAGAKKVNEIFVVGPAERLEKALEDFSFQKPVHYIPQKKNVFENIWKGFYSTLPEDVGHMSGKELIEAGHAEKSIFVVTCDTPLMRSQEVDSFIDDADPDIDLVLGVTPKEMLMPFAPDGKDPGIKFAYFCFREFIVRHSNIYIMKPLRHAKVMEEYIPLVYGIRYQKQLRNMLPAMSTLLGLAYRLGFMPLYFFIAFQIARSLDGRGYLKARDWVRRRLPQRLVVNYVNRLLDTPTSIQLTKSPGPALDIDNEPDLEIAEKMFDKWQEILTNIINGSYKLPSP